MKPLFLIGFRGAGKSTVGELVARQMQWTFADADRYIEQQAGKTIREIFADVGERGFRDLETSVLGSLAEADGSDSPAVIALGGGVVLRTKNRQLLRQGTVVWLKVGEAAAVARLEEDPATAEQRPPLTAGGPREEVRSLLEMRGPLYEECADYSLDTDDRSAAEVAEQIVSWLRKREARSG